MSGICQFTIPASRDIEGIMDSIADYGSFDTAEQFLSDLNAKCAKLAQFPGMGRKRDELSPGLRSFPIDRYLIFYCEITTGIEITRVVSGYQDLERLFSEDDDRLPPQS